MVFKHIRRHPNIWRDVGLLGLSLALAAVLAETGAIARLLVVSQVSEVLGSFVTGFFFVFIFTVAPATVALVELAEISGSIFLIVFWAALGSAVGDFIIFKFVRDNLADNIHFILKKMAGSRRLHHFGQIPLVRFFIPIIGALMVASPLPDEAGLALMGLSKVKVRYFLPLVFSLNFVGLWLLLDFGQFLIK